MLCSSQSCFICGEVRDSPAPQRVEHSSLFTNTKSPHRWASSHPVHTHTTTPHTYPSTNSHTTHTNLLTLSQSLRCYNAATCWQTRAITPFPAPLSPPALTLTTRGLLPLHQHHRREHPSSSISKITLYCVFPHRCLSETWVAGS